MFSSYPNRIYTKSHHVPSVQEHVRSDYNPQARVDTDINFYHPNGISVAIVCLASD